ncbi:MAG: MFS transporter [Thermoleophilia bacterium]
MGLTAANAELRAGGGSIPRGLVVLLAVACGATVANLYYAQPLLSAIADAFGISEAAAGLLVTVTQVAYAAGLVFLVPLGDLLDRRRLVVTLLLVSGAGMALAALAPGVAVLAAALGLAALTSVVVQILIPFASILAPVAESGRVVGTVMSGVLIGVLLARTVSGILADALGWRAPFAVAAILMAGLAAALARTLPRVAPSSSLPYGRLLRSIGTLVTREPVLRHRMVYGACGFAGFTVVWTSLAFLLAGDPYRYSERAIGLFGLAGLVGALGAQGMGRAHDRGHGRIATAGVLTCILASWALLLWGGTSVTALIVGLLVLDFGVQGQMVLSQGAIYELGAENASRVTTAYMTACFAGGTVGSAAAAAAWSLGGWSAVCVAGAVFAAVALAAWAAVTPAREALPRRRGTAPG